MTRPLRISPAEARRAVEQDDALLVCAYDDESKCEKLRLNGSISFAELERRLDDVSQDRRLVFY